MAEFGEFGRRESLVLNSGTFEGLKGARDDAAMSVAGAAWKTAILLDITLGSAAWAWVTLAGGANPGS